MRKNLCKIYPENFDSDIFHEEIIYLPSVFTSMLKKEKLKCHQDLTVFKLYLKIFYFYFILFYNQINTQ
jgi:hypothetical protein